MIIRWDNSVDDLIRVDEKVLREAVGELTRAYRRGHHLVIISRRVSHWLLGRDGFSDIEKVTIARLRDEFTQNGQAHTNVSRYIEITSSNDELAQYKGNAIQVSLRSIAKGNIADKTQLLIENEVRDGWVYQFIMENLSDLFGHRFIAVDLTHGGGNDIVAVAARKVKESRLILVVVDSDRPTPVTLANPKYNKINTKISKHGSPLAVVSSPPCREIENLIPIDIICQIPSAYGEAANVHLLSIKDGEAAESHPKSEAYGLFFDFKEGLKCEKISRFNADEMRWIVSKLHIAGLTDKSGNISGYGERVIDQIRDNNALCSILRDQIRRKDWLEVFGVYFKGVIENFVATRPLVT